MNNPEKLNKYLDIYSDKLKNVESYFVCNIKSNTSDHDLSQGKIYETEFLSDEELEQIIEMFYQNNIPYKVFQNEKAFMSFVLEKNEIKPETIVYNSAQSGTGAGRKALVPAFCNLFNIKVTGSNPYVVSLCRHKYHVNRLLYNHGFPVPETWLYDYGWYNNKKPVNGKKLIIKPIYESASISIEKNSVVNYEDSVDMFIKEKQQALHQPIIAQEFISGYEVEVPVICTSSQYITLIPVGLSVSQDTLMGDEFLDYERIYFDKYSFFDFTNQSVYQSSMLDTVNCAAQLLGMHGLCRIDFRISENGTYYITDVSTNPHFIQHSSVHYAYLKCGLTEAHILKTILCSALD